MNTKIHLSKNLPLVEAIKSNTAIKNGIDNSPTEEHLANMKLVADKIFQPVREHFNIPIGVTSMYRSAALNKVIGGAKSSSHMTGQAIDMDADVYGGVTNKEIFEYIIANLTFDTIIWEFGTSDEPAWIHVAYREDNNRNRRLVAYKDQNKNTQYKFYS